MIDRAYALDEIVEATRYVETGQKTGNVVLRVGGAPATGAGEEPAARVAVPAADNWGPRDMPTRQVEPPPPARTAAARPAT